MDSCGTCGEVNRAGAAFCASCGSPILRPCEACGNVPAAGARFCDRCGTELATGAGVAIGPQSARKLVTVVFADLKGSTSQQEQMDPEAVRAWIDRFHAALRQAIEAHGGRLVKVMGDGVMAAFGVPEVREDDARRALEAALAMQEALASIDPDARLRVGINTGEVVVSPDDADVVGDAVNVAARLEHAAGPGEILIGESTFRLVRLTAQLRALPPLDLKGKSEPVQAFQLIELDPVRDVGDATQFVGRQPELHRLAELLDEAVKDQRARLATIVGSPGLGKTRLARQLVEEVSSRARVVEVRCEPAGGTTFAPIAEALRVAASLDEDASDDTIVAALTALFDEDAPDRDRVAAVAAAVLGVGEPRQPEETFWAVRRLVENAARRRPIVLIFDDVHWAEPLLLDLIENLAEWARDAPMLLVLTARPELRDLRPSLVEVGGRLSASLHLEGLDHDESWRLACEILDADDLPLGLFERINAVSQGNPLFVGELLRMLVDDGVLERHEDAWTAVVDLAAVDLPPTIHSLLGARIDRLADDERTVLEAASVMGKTFYRGAVSSVVAPDVRDRLDGVLERLRRKELVEPAGTYWIDEPVWRFHHVLIRDAAYRRLLKEARAELHGRMADWFETKVGDLAEHDDVIGYQLEQAFALRAELGTVDRQSGRRAAARLAAAGRRSLEADDTTVAAALLGRAIDCLGEDDDDLAELLVDRCEALLSAGDVSGAAPVLERLTEHALTDERLHGWVDCFSAEVANLTSTASLSETAAKAATAAQRLADLGDVAGEAKAHAVRADSLARLGRIGECEGALDLALGAARRAGDRRRATAVLAGAPVAALWGPNPVTRASGRCLDVVRVLRITSQAPAVEATSLRCQAVLESLRGRPDAGRRMLAAARHALEELGKLTGLLELDVADGMVASLAGDLDAAEQHLRRARDGLHGLGLEADAAFASALLASVLVELGRVDEALALTVESERLGSDDLRTTIAWRAVRADALASQGAVDEARSVAEAAVALAEQTDALVDHAKALASLARVLRAAGDESGAEAHARRALDLYRQKEATVLAEDVERFIGAEHQAQLDAAEGPPMRWQPTNRATRLADRVAATVNLADPDAFGAMLDPDIELRDHRPLLQVELRGRREFLAHMASMAELGVSGITLEPLMARGEDLALVRTTWTGSGFAVTTLNIYELGGTGLLAAADLYDDEHVDDAVIELDRRFMARESAEHAAAYAPGTRWMEGVLRRDWDLARSAFHDDFVCVDHRPMGWGVLGPDEFVSLYSAAAELAPDLWGGFFVVHAIDDRGASVRGEIRAARSAEGGPFGTAASLTWLTRDGRIAHAEYFPEDQPERAVAALRGAPGDVLENAATHTWRRMADATVADQLDAAVALFAEEGVSVDRRRLVGGLSAITRGDVKDTLLLVRELGLEELASTPLAIRGDRLALLHVRYGGPPGAPSDVEALHVVELDDQDRIVRNDLFDLDDLVEATTLLDHRFVEGDEAQFADTWRCASSLMDAISMHDIDAARAVTTEEYVLDDHRPLGWGPISRDEWLGLIEVAIQQTPDVRWPILRDLEVAEGVAYYQSALRGTREDGGEVVSPILVILQVDAGRSTYADIYTPEDRAAADARFAELTATGATTPQKPSNAVTRLVDDASRALLRADFEAATAIYRDDVVITDKRSLVGGFEFHGRAEAARALESIHSFGLQALDWEPVAVRGDRLALVRSVYRTQDAEVTTLDLLEADQLGKVARATTYHEEQLDEAMAKIDELFTELSATSRALADVTRTSEGPSTSDRPTNAVTRAFEVTSNAIVEADFEGALGWYSDDVVIEDRRPVVGGYELRGAAGAQQGVETLYGIGVRAVDVQPVAIRGDHLALVEANYRGRDAEGIVLLLLETDDSDQLAHATMYDIDQLDEALVQLNERFLLGEAGGSTCWRCVSEGVALMNARDWSGFRAVLDDGFELTDHRPLSFGTIDADGWIDTSRTLVEQAPDVLWTAIVIHGVTDRFVCGLAAVSGTSRLGGPFSTQMWVVAQERGGRWFRHEIFGTQAEMQARFDELVAPGPVAPFNEATKANASLADAFDDQETWAAHFTEDIVLCDHRPVVGAGLEQVGREAAMEALAGIKNVGARPSSWTQLAVRGQRLALTKLLFAGDAGEVEIVQVLETTEEGHVARTDTFEPDQLDEAIALLDERFLDGEAQDSAAWRCMVELYGAANRRDWDGLRQLLHDGFVGVDHRPLSFGDVDPEGLVAAFRGLVDQAEDVHWTFASTYGVSDHRACGLVHAAGTSDYGASFVTPVWIMATERDGRWLRLDAFDSLDATSAWLEQLPP